MKYRWIIFSICLIGIIVYLGIEMENGCKRIDNAFKQNQRGLNEVLPSTFFLSSEDSNLFSNYYREKIEVEEVYQSKVRNPISSILFDKKYNIIIYKIDLTKNNLFKDLLHVKNESVNRSVGTSYRIIYKNNFFRFQCKAGPTQTISDIYLTLTGDSLQTLTENDSIICYNFLCKYFSIKYSAKDPIDIFVESQNKLTGRLTIPMNLLFLKRKKAIYLLLLTPNRPDSSIPTKLLLKIVTGE